MSLALLALLAAPGCGDLPADSATLDPTLLPADNVPLDRALIHVDPPEVEAVAPEGDRYAFPTEGGAAVTVDPPDAAVPYTTAFGSPMLVIPAGTFRMAAGEGDPFDSFVDHDVTITRDFWLGEHEITQAEWARWRGAPNPYPSYFAGDELPVEQVSWPEVVGYANALSVAEGLPPCYEPDGSGILAAWQADPAACPGYRLPTEAEWELAARAGEDTAFAGSGVAADVAWYSGNSDGRTHPTCTLERNAWGLCDMSGNVKEWVNDWFDAAYGGYGDGSASVDPGGPVTGEDRVRRGGSWFLDASGSRVAVRNYDYPGIRLYCVGFRLARTSSVR